MKYTLSEFIAELQKDELEHGSKIVVTLDGDDNGNFFVDEIAVGFLAKIPVEHQLSDNRQEGYFSICSALYTQLT